MPQRIDSFFGDAYVPAAQHYNLGSFAESEDESWLCSSSNRSHTSTSFWGGAGNITPSSIASWTHEDEFDRESTFKVHQMFENIDALLYRDTHSDDVGDGGHVEGGQQQQQQSAARQSSGSTAALQAECEQWSGRFPHMRIRGRALWGPTASDEQGFAFASPCTVTSGCNVPTIMTHVVDPGCSHSMLQFTNGLVPPGGGPLSRPSTSASNLGLASTSGSLAGSYSGLNSASAGASANSLTQTGPGRELVVHGFSISPIDLSSILSVETSACSFQGAPPSPVTSVSGALSLGMARTPFQATFVNPIPEPQPTEELVKAASLKHDGVDDNDDVKEHSYLNLCDASIVSAMHDVLVEIGGSMNWLAVAYTEVKHSVGHHDTFKMTLLRCGSGGLAEMRGVLGSHALHAVCRFTHSVKPALALRDLAQQTDDIVFVMITWLPENNDEPIDFLLHRSDFAIALQRFVGTECGGVITQLLASNFDDISSDRHVLRTMQPVAPLIEAANAELLLRNAVITSTPDSGVNLKISSAQGDHSTGVNEGDMDTAAPIYDWNVQFAHLAEEVFIRDGEVEEYFAFDVTNDDEYAVRSRRDGIPPITPNACLRDAITSLVFDRVWEKIIQVLHPGLEILITTDNLNREVPLNKAPIKGAPIKDATSDILGLGTAMTIKSVTIQRKMQRRNSLAVHDPFDGSVGTGTVGAGDDGPQLHSDQMSLSGSLTDLINGDDEWVGSVPTTGAAFAAGPVQGLSLSSMGPLAGPNPNAMSAANAQFLNYVSQLTLQSDGVNKGFSAPAPRPGSRGDRGGKEYRFLKRNNPSAVRLSPLDSLSYTSRNQSYATESNAGGAGTLVGVMGTGRVTRGHSRGGIRPATTTSISSGLFNGQTAPSTNSLHTNVTAGGGSNVAQCTSPPPWDPLGGARLPPISRPLGGGIGAAAHLSGSNEHISGEFVRDGGGGVDSRGRRALTHSTSTAGGTVRANSASTGVTKHPPSAGASSSFIGVISSDIVNANGRNSATVGSSKPYRMPNNYLTSHQRRQQQQSGANVPSTTSGAYTSGVPAVYNNGTVAMAGAGRVGPISFDIDGEVVASGAVTSTFF